MAILDRHVFADEKVKLITKIADNPERFVGIFRSSTPRAKLIQNVSQSREIRFGDGMEEIVREYLTEMGFVHLDKVFVTEASDDTDEETKSCDQYFRTADETKYYLVEQKVRDDHDSTKKRGQADNFRAKVAHLHKLHGDRLVAMMFFIDPALEKNRRYYQDRLSAVADEFQIPVHLFYDGEFFSHFGHGELWSSLVGGLKAWRKNIPEQATVNFDADPVDTTNALISLPGNTWHKIISNDALWESGLIQALFPTGDSLKSIRERMEKRGGEKFRVYRGSVKYVELAYRLQQRIDEFYKQNSLPE